MFNTKNMEEIKNNTIDNNQRMVLVSPAEKKSCQSRAKMFKSLIDFQYYLISKHPNCLFNIYRTRGVDKFRLYYEQDNIIKKYNVECVVDNAGIVSFYVYTVINTYEFCIPKQVEEFEPPLIKYFPRNVYYFSNLNDLYSEFLDHFLNYDRSKQKYKRRKCNLSSCRKRPIHFMKLQSISCTFNMECCKNCGINYNIFICEITENSFVKSNKKDLVLTSNCMENYSPDFLSKTETFTLDFINKFNETGKCTMFYEDHDGGYDNESDDTNSSVKSTITTPAKNNETDIRKLEKLLDKEVTSVLNEEEKNSLMHIYHKCVEKYGKKLENFDINNIDHIVIVNGFKKNSKIFLLVDKNGGTCRLSKSFLTKRGL